MSLASLFKAAAAIGSATPDPVKGEATGHPVPPPAVANKPAPGQTGPRGLAPRTTYARVNTGSPPVPDAGGSGQKSQSPRGLEFLPAKVAHKESTSMSTTMFQRPNLQDLVKEAMEGTVERINVNLEAQRQLAGLSDEPEQEKQAAAPTQLELTPTDYITKLAGALDYLAKQAAEGTAAMGPGKGPGAIEVQAATSSEENIDAGQMGQATTGNQPPKNPPMQSSGVAKDPPNAMQANDDMQHPEQPVDPMGNEKTSAIYASNLARLGLTKEAIFNPIGAAVGGLSVPEDQIAEGALRGGLGSGIGGMVGVPIGAIGGGTIGALGGGALGGLVGRSPEAIATGVGLGGTIGGGIGATAGGLGGAIKGYRMGMKGMRRKKRKDDDDEEKTSSVLDRNLARLGIQKEAEDAINPAKIAAGHTQTGATPPEGASASEEKVPSEPGDVTSQKSMISSNQAAIDYTKGKAKADPKSDVNKVLDEPALTSSTDSTLNKVLDHTSQAGVKISQDLTRTAAAQALLHKLAEEACGEKKNKEKKEKQSQGMPGLSNPSGQSGFSASSMGM